MERKEISVEISPVCNLHCPNCNVSERLHIPNRRNDANLVGKLIEHTPINAHLSFVGLGETTIPESQGRIARVLNQRKDLTGFIQTNGSYQLNPNILNLVDSRRLEFGLSTDYHHLLGGQKPHKIQPEYVFSIATSVENRDQILNYRKIFPRLNRILVSPMLDKEGVRVMSSWEHVEEMCHEFQKVLGKGVSVYSELPLLFRREENEEYFRDAEKALVKTKHLNWMASKKYGFYVDVELPDPSKDTRFLIDGTYVTDVAHALKNWKEVDKHSKPIESLPKVFDSQTKVYFN